MEPKKLSGVSHHNPQYVADIIMLNNIKHTVEIKNQHLWLTILPNWQRIVEEALNNMTFMLNHVSDTPRKTAQLNNGSFIPYNDIESAIVAFHTAYFSETIVQDILIHSKKLNIKWHQKYAQLFPRLKPTIIRHQSDTSKLDDTLYRVVDCHFTIRVLIEQYHDHWKCMLEQKI